MAETGRLAAWMGLGKGFEIREYPVPDPKPGALLIKVAIANVCGSDMHYWKGEQDMEKRGRTLPLNTGHEHSGTVHKLGAGVTTDSTGQPLREGDRVIYRYFTPCGRCRACLRRQFKSCPTRQANWSRHLRRVAALPGRLRRVLLPRPEPRHLQDPRRDHRRDGRRDQLRLHPGVRRRSRSAGFRPAGPSRSRARAGSASTPARSAREMGAARVDRDRRRARSGSRSPSDFGADEIVDLREFPTPAARIERVLRAHRATGAPTSSWSWSAIPNVVDEGLRMTAPEGTYLEIGNINVGWETRFDPSWILFGNRRIIGVAHYEAEHLKGALDLMMRTRQRVPVRPDPLPQVPARRDQRGLPPAGGRPHHARRHRAPLSWPIRERGSASGRRGRRAVAGRACLPRRRLRDDEHQVRPRRRRDRRRSPTCATTRPSRRAPGRPGASRCRSRRSATASSGSAPSYANGLGAPLGGHRDLQRDARLRAGRRRRPAAIALRQLEGRALARADRRHRQRHPRHARARRPLQGDHGHAAAARLPAHEPRPRAARDPAPRRAARRLAARLARARLRGGDRARPPDDARRHWRSTTWTRRGPRTSCSRWCGI